MKLSFVLAGHALAGKMHYIIGGNDVTDRAEYPYVVSLQYLSTRVHFCGGSIINSHWVMSAAHCHMPDAIGVAAGSIDRRFPTQFTENLAFQRHPQYRGSSGCEDFDYAMILTRKDFDFTDPFVQPIKLAPAGDELPGGTPVWQSGWGINGYGPDGKPSGSTDTLQYGVYFAVTIRECQQTWGTCYVGNEGRQQCAIGPNGQQDPEFNPDPDYSHCEWDEYKNHYLGGYTSLGPASFWTLDEAKEACETLSATDCGGICYTKIGFEYKYEPRRGPVQQPSPDPNEAAYIRPTVLNPPKDCEPKMKMKPSHRVTSCMGDSGGPLVMKGENGEDLLVGNTSWGSGSCSDGYPAAWSNNRNPEVQSWIKYNANLDY